MNNIRLKISNIDIRYYLALIVLLYILAKILLYEFIIKDEYYYRTFGEQISLSRIDKLLDFMHKWYWFEYIFKPIFILIKICFVAFCFKTGVILFNLNVSFKQLLRITILAEIIFVIALYVKTFWLLFYSKHLTLEYISYFYPMSFINLVTIKEVPKYLIYPFQVVNLFELAYWIVLAFLIKVYTNFSFDKSLGFVAKTYGAGLLAWVVLVVFVSIN